MLLGCNRFNESEKYANNSGNNESLHVHHNNRQMLPNFLGDLLRMKQR